MDDKVPLMPGEDDEALDVLERLIDQLQGSGYQDQLGHRIEMNVAFRDAVALLTLRGRG